MKHIIHVNQFVIKKNKKTGERKPVLTVKNYKENRYAHEVAILDKDGKEVARIVYRPDKPLSCGARCWIETTYDIKLITDSDDGSLTPSPEAEEQSSAFSSDEPCQSQ